VKKFEDMTPREAPIGYGIVQPGAFDYTGTPVAGIYTINSNSHLWYMSSKKMSKHTCRAESKQGMYCSL
jgi:hypothetical protein